ncbi:MAG: hypothetical protein GC160_04305 [Acidobacteria bacterium]|nr:hypothetical protein [Acidobacteriota bacterium]
MSFVLDIEDDSPPALSPEAAAACDARLKALCERVSGRISAVLAGPDGFELTALVEGGLSVPKLAALASTLTAVGDALARETGLPECDDLLMQTSAGAALIRAVPVGAQRYSLIVISNERTVLGKLLVVSRECAHEIAEEIARYQ